LLAAACGLSFARALPSELGMLRAVGVSCFGWSHVVQCLQWAGAGGGLGHRLCNGDFQQTLEQFADLLGYIGAVVEAGEDLEPLRTVAMWPIESEGELSCGSLADGQIFTHLAPDLDTPGRSKILVTLRRHKLVRVLARQLQAKFDGPAASLTNKMGLGGATLPAAADVLLPVVLRGDLAEPVFWAAVSVVRDCQMQDQDSGSSGPAELRGKLKLYGWDGKLHPAGELVLPSILGWDWQCHLPTEVIQTIAAFASGLLVRACGNLDDPGYVTVSREFLRVQEDVLAWEAWLDAVGVTRPNPGTGIDWGLMISAAVVLGGRLSSSGFWEACIQSNVLRYVASYLAEASWMRRLPVLCPSRPWEQVSVDGLYSTEPFARLVGKRRLPFVNLDGALALAEAHGKIALLRKCWDRLGVKTRATTHVLLQLLVDLRSRGNVEEVGIGNIYAALGECGEDIHLPANFGISVPPHDKIPPRQCVWSAPDKPIFEAILNMGQTLHVLERVYGDSGAGARSFFINQAGVRDKLVVRDYITILLNLPVAIQRLESGDCRDEYDQASALPPDFLQNVQSVALDCYFAIGEMCRTGGPKVVDETRNAFSCHRLILVPVGASWRFLTLSEAFWAVETELQDEPCAAIALSKHYGQWPEMRDLFHKVLFVRPMLGMLEVEQIIGEYHRNVYRHQRQQATRAANGFFPHDYLHREDRSEAQASPRIVTHYSEHDWGEEALSRVTNHLYGGAEEAAQLAEESIEQGESSWVEVKKQRAAARNLSAVKTTNGIHLLCGPHLNNWFGENEALMQPVLDAVAAVAFKVMALKPGAVNVYIDVSNGEGVGVDAREGRVFLHAQVWADRLHGTNLSDQYLLLLTEVCRQLAEKYDDATYYELLASYTERALQLARPKVNSGAARRHWGRRGWDSL